MEILMELYFVYQNATSSNNCFFGYLKQKENLSVGKNNISSMPNILKWEYIYQKNNRITEP